MGENVNPPDEIQRVRAENTRSVERVRQEIQRLKARIAALQLAASEKKPEAAGLTIGAIHNHETATQLPYFQRNDPGRTIMS